MKTLQKITLAIGLITIFASCQTNTDINRVLYNSDSRKEIIDTIANNSKMSEEVMKTMLNSRNGKMLILENEKMAKMLLEDHVMIVKMMKDNPGLMQCMLSDMMETCKGDTCTMASMCKILMGNKGLMNML